MMCEYRGKAFKVCIDISKFSLQESYWFTLWLGSCKCLCFSTPSSTGSIIHFSPMLEVLIWIYLIRGDKFHVFNNHLVIFLTSQRSVSFYLKSCYLGHSLWWLTRVTIFRFLLWVFQLCTCWIPFIYTPCLFSHILNYHDLLFLFHFSYLLPLLLFLILFIFSYVSSTFVFIYVFCLFNLFLGILVNKHLILKHM